jgi:hypothetical protein
MAVSLPREEGFDPEFLVQVEQFSFGIIIGGISWQDILEHPAGYVDVKISKCS